MKKVELFTAECRLCEKMLNALTRNFPKVKITVHRASECKDGSCCSLAERYEIKAIPSLVIDGKVALVGLPNEEQLKSLAIMLQP